MSTNKREDYISWDEYFMGVAILSAQRSKDPNTQVGACIVNDDRKILTVGYNGLPIGCSDDDFPWSREGGTYETKYAYVCHAEMNAILNCNTALKDSTIYVSLFPCQECTKALIQKGIREIIYADDKYHDTEGAAAARRMLDAAGVIYRPYAPSGRSIEINV
ncbi:MAG: dCMP deaminase family protein [Clostridiales bacterium]|nr:dCMP deaminase family protein [Clostridiales bacterium]